MGAEGDNGVRVIHVDDLKALMVEASETGARRALASLGLADEHAADDMREMRAWLSAWRTAKKTAWKTTVGLVTKAVLVLVLLGLAWKLGLKLPNN